MTSGLKYNDFDAVYLAGGIGQAMNVDDAVTIGLIPAGLKEKSIALGNASLGGAALSLLAPSKTSAEVTKLLDVYIEINLAAHPDFNDLFMEFMFFE